MSKPILIAGAGPVGLTLACELTRHGCPVRIVDKNLQPTDKSKALVLWPRTLELLEKAGCVQRFLDAGVPMAGMSIFENPGKRLAHITFEDLRSPFSCILGIPQSETERLLVQRLEELGVQVERGVEVLGIEPQESDVKVTLRHPDGREEVTETDWLPACDGARSTVRHGLGVRLEGETVDQEFAMIDCDVTGLPFYDEVIAFPNPDGVTAFFPMGGARMRVICLRNEMSPGEAPPPPTLEEMQEEMSKRGLVHVVLSEPRWLAAFRINERSAASYRHGRVLLAGDSAHVHSPIGGQGMNTGMQDAFNLAWKLARVVKGRLPESFIDSYSAERQPVGAAVVQQTGRARKMITLRHPVATAIRNRVVSLLTSFDFVRHKIIQETSELAVKYPKSPLNREVHDGHAAWILGQGIHPGDRAPDGDLHHGEKESRLFAEMADTRFHVLILSGVANRPIYEALECARWVQEDLSHDFGLHWVGYRQAQLPDLPGVWHDPDGAIHKDYGASEPTLYLIRPDGYVAFRCQPALRADLEKYLQDMGLLPAVAEMS